MGSTPISGTLRQFSFNTLNQVSAPNFTVRFVERRLRRGTQTLRELQEELRITNDQLEFILDDARDKEVRAMVAETPNAALEHHEAQRHLEVIHRHRDYLVKAIAANQIHQDQLLDRLTN